MCEINPVHAKVYRLEVFTSDKHMSPADFEHEVTEMLVQAELQLNESGKFRFHIHEGE